MADNTLIRHLLYAVVMFTMVIVGGTALLGIYSEHAPTMLDHPSYDNFTKAFNKMDNVTAKIDKIDTDIQSSDTDYGLFGVLNSLIATSWNSLAAIGSSFSFLTEIWSGTTTVFGIPAWAATLVGSLVTILISFTIWSAVFQRDI